MGKWWAAIAAILCVGAVWFVAACDNGDDDGNGNPPATYDRVVLAELASSTF